MRYRITEICGWVIVGLSGRAENNEPLKVKHLFKRWLTAREMRVIVNLKEIEEFGVWEMGLLTSFKKEMDQRGGTLSYIAESGSIGDYIDSLNRLRCFGLSALYPGHGRISTAPVEDIDRAIENAMMLLEEKSEDRMKIFYYKQPESLESGQAVEDA